MRVYLYTLQAFLKFPEWMQEVDLTSDRVAIIVTQVGQNANAMGKRVNKERVEREAETLALNLLQLELAMV